MTTEKARSSTLPLYWLNWNVETAVFVEGSCGIDTQMSIFSMKIITKNIYLVITCTKRFPIKTPIPKKKLNIL